MTDLSGDWWARGAPVIANDAIGTTDVETALSALMDGGFTDLHQHALTSETPVNAVAATQTVTSDNTNVSNNDTVTVNGKSYTFKTSLTPAEGEVLIGGSADASLTNLAHAINGTGGTAGTDYQVAAAHPTVGAGTVSSHVITLTALAKGAAGNALTLTKSATHLTVGGATLSGGINGTTGTAGELRYDTTTLYLCINTQTVADTNWRAVSLTTL